MSRYTLHTRSGWIAARGIYRLPFPALLCHTDRRPLLPGGSFITGADALAAGWSSQPNPAIIFISQPDLTVFPRGEFSGCCGPSGDCKNVIDPATMEPVAWEFADCHGAHYVWFEPADYELVEESPEEPECLVGLVRLNRVTWLVGAACGRDRREATRRLDPACRDYVETEAAQSSHNRKISRLPVEILPAAEFFQRYKRDSKPRWLSLRAWK